MWSARLSFLPFPGAETGLVGVLPLPLIFDLPENTIRTKEQTITRADPSRNQSLGVSNFTKRVELLIDFWKLDDIFEPPGQNELIECKRGGGFYLSLRIVWGSRASRVWPA